MKETVRTAGLLMGMGLALFGVTRFVDWRYEQVRNQYHVELEPVMTGCHFDWTAFERHSVPAKQASIP